MSKRWLGCIVLVVVGWSSTALAALSSANVDVGDVVVTVPSTSGTKDGTASSSATDLLDHFTLIGAGCTAFSITTGAVTLPHTIDTATPMDFTVHFTPTARGTLTCTVSFRNAADVSIGTNFTIQGKGVAQQISAPASVAFGSIRHDNAAVLTVTRNIVITNNGDAGHDLTITDLAISGSSDFTITVPTLPLGTPIVLAATGSTTVTVVFDPAIAGLQNASLDITSDDPLTPTKSVPLTGTGTNAVIGVTDVAFGVVNLTATKILTTAVTNNAATNPGPLRIASATITDPSGWFTFDANGFACTGNQTCTFGAAPGILAPQNIGVRCTPPAGSSGSMAATVAFTSDTDGGGDNTAALSCTAGRADISVNPASIPFGNVDVGATVVQTVTVTNLTPAPNIDLVFTATKIGARQAEYTLSGCFSACAVPAGTSKQFTLSFTPTARSATAGSANITVNLASNDPDNANVPIPVTANAIAPVITTPASLAFGNVEVVTTTTKTLTVTNSGDDDLVISSSDFTVNDGSYAIASGGTGLQTVTPGNSTSWDITCTPATSGAHNGTFQIQSNALAAATRNVPLTCTGTEGIVVTIPTSINFGGVTELTVATLPVKLHNSGNLVVNGITGTFGGTGTGYSVDPATPVPSSLLPGAANDVTINILFSPLSGADGGPATLTFNGTWGTGAKPLRVPAVLDIDGDGLKSGFDVTPPTLDFGDLRFDTTKALTFCITNTQQAPVQIKSPITITPGAGTASGEFTAGVTVKRQATCGVGGVAQVLPQTLAAGENLEVTVTADPANRIGAMNALLTVTSNLANPNTTATVTLVGNSTTAGLTLDPASSTLDFGAVDIQAGPQTKNITITNSGTGPLDLKSFTRTANPHFTFALPPNTTLNPTETLTIPVTYTPVAVTMPAESITLSNTIAGILGGPANEMIIITGRGIDREIQLAAAPTFPDTFRNPGAAAPVRPVTVTNMGEATLHITALMVTTADPTVWTLVDPTPVDIPGLTSHDFLVRFAPNVIGTAPPATLELSNDDSDEMMASVQLSGVGIGRNVGFGQMEIDLGYTGIGVPVTIDDALLVQSMDSVNGFTITNITLEGDSVFAFDGATQNIELPASGSHVFGMTFTAETEGDFTATAHLFLDADQVSTADIPIRGHAVFVDAHGGGGCATGHDAGGGALVLVAIVLVGLRKRRVLAGIALTLALIPAARADNVVLSVFDPTPATTGTTFQLQSPEVGNNGDWVINATVSHATNPLILDAIINKQFFNNDHVVERSTLLELGGAYAFLGRFEAGLRMPIYAQDGEPLVDRQTKFMTNPASGTASGDLTLHVKARLAKIEGFTLGGGLQLTLPTASDGAFTGVDKPSARLLVLAALVPDTLSRRITLSATTGPVLRAKSSYANLEQGSGVAWGLGLSVRALDRMWIGAEVFGDVVPSGKQTEMGNAQTLSPIEWLGGLRYYADHRFSIGLAAGRGLTSAAGAPALRGVLELAYAPGAPELRPIHIPGPPKIDGDRDGDGIPDSIDKCPNEPEDKDMFDDADGCPDPDNDQDGIPDVVDKCPLDPEDKDGFEDADGCPDLDNDKDGIPDSMDKCPNEAEDKDGFEDLDGCPDPDNDKDGIPDVVDKCPNQPETINGFQDDDGCPDAGDSVIVLSPDRIETLDAIQFTGGNKIAKASNNVLGQVAATLRAHTEIVRLRVTVHVQPTQNTDADQALSDKRAQAVRDWLVQWGIAAKRVEARGFGGTKPLAPPTQRGSAAVNDRVELIILERK